MSLDREPDIVKLAYELKVDLTDGPVAGILQFCKRKLQGWVREAGLQINSTGDLERVARLKLRLVFEEVWSDLDVDSLIKKYLSLGEPVFATLKHDLNAETFAALIERHTTSSQSPDRYVAVIDCRGDKHHRRFFTKWHEVAHLLTLTRQLQLPFHRSTTDRSPLERLMDTIAGEIGFPDEGLRRALQQESDEHTLLTFDGVERIRAAVCPEASFMSTLNACVARSPRPLLLLEVGMGLKKSERQAYDSPQLTMIPRPKPTAKVRVLNVVSSQAARKTRFRIDRYMEVPRGSVAFQAFAGDVVPISTESPRLEDLGIWVHSDGNAVGSGPVRVQVKFAGRSLYAIVQREPKGRNH